VAVVTARPSPLLCELHAHTTWSDGVLSIGEAVDLYGAAGFDVLCITDHVVPAGAPCRAVDADGHAAYLEEIEAEAARAARDHGLLVLPGSELTLDDPDPLLAAHAVAVGLRVHVPLDAGIAPAVRRARESGAAIIAAHPYSPESATTAPRRTAAFAADPELRGAVDRFELVNRHDVFDWVARERLPAVATGDFHRPEHLSTWKTLLPCAQTEAAVVGYLRSSLPAYLVRFTADEALAA
jgi:processive 1,2-diacylglycerol beta-glucosyltransferase